MDTHRSLGAFAFSSVAVLVLASCTSGGYNGSAPGAVPQTSNARSAMTNVRSTDGRRRQEDYSRARR